MRWLVRRVYAWAETPTDLELWEAFGHGVGLPPSLGVEDRARLALRARAGLSCSA